MPMNPNKTILRVCPVRICWNGRDGQNLKGHIYNYNHTLDGQTWRQIHSWSIRKNLSTVSLHLRWYRCIVIGNGIIRISPIVLLYFKITIVFEVISDHGVQMMFFIKCNIISCCSGPIGIITKSRQTVTVYASQIRCGFVTCITFT